MTGDLGPHDEGGVDEEDDSRYQKVGISVKT